MIKKKLLVFSIVFFSITFNSFSIEPDIFVQSTVNRASKLLGEDISKEEKIEKLKTIAKETVDIRGIGFYTLGKKRKSLKTNKPYWVLYTREFINDNDEIIPRGIAVVWSKDVADNAVGKKIDVKFLLNNKED